MEHLTLTHVESKRVKGKQHVIYLTSCEWMAEQELGEKLRGQTLYRATNDRKLWRAMIANVLKDHST